MKSTMTIEEAFAPILTPAPQPTGLRTLLPTRSSRALKEQAVTELMKNSCAAMLTGTAIQHVGALCALERSIYESNPYSGEFCRPLLEAYVVASAQQIWQFGKR